MFAFKQEMLTEIFSVFIWSQVKQTADKKKSWQQSHYIKPYLLLCPAMS